MSTTNVKGMQLGGATDSSLFTIQQRQILAGLIGVTQQLAEHRAEERTFGKALGQVLLDRE